MQRHTFMFRAIGFILVLVVLSKMFTHAFVAAERAAVEGFKTLEIAAVMTQEHILSN